MEQAYIDLIHRSFSGVLSEEENEKLQAWLKADPGNQQTYDELFLIWKATPQLAEKKTATYTLNTETQLKVLQQKIQPSAPQKTVIRTLSPLRKFVAAASILLLITAGWWFSQSSNASWAIAKTDAGAIQEIQLSDGTMVWLNENSELTYPKTFKGSKRQVHLNGEAYFEVAKDPNKPFMIEGPATQIEVLGTKFNYQTTNPDGAAVTRVLEGKVRFSPLSTKGETANLILTENEKGIYRKGENTLEAFEDQAQNAIAWKTGRLVLDNMKIPEVIQLIEQHYQTRIDYQQSGIGDCRLTSEFEIDKLETVLEILELTYQLTVNESSNGGYELIGGNCE
ncbi:MAG: FecR domain-containing protein [Bacteroidota bacterium]